VNDMMTRDRETTNIVRYESREYIAGGGSNTREISFVCIFNLILCTSSTSPFKTRFELYRPNLHPVPGLTTFGPIHPGKLFAVFVNKSGDRNRMQSV
jgi:hypothetical protein